jgi:hypothetical protein
MQSCSHAVLQSCSLAVLQSCSHAVMQSVFFGILPKASLREALGVRYSMLFYVKKHRTSNKEYRISKTFQPSSLQPNSLIA